MVRVYPNFTDVGSISVNCNPSNAIVTLSSKTPNHEKGGKRTTRLRLPRREQILPRSGLMSRFPILGVHRDMLRRIVRIGAKICPGLRKSYDLAVSRPIHRYVL
jgi:hypothetical protein